MPTVNINGFTQFDNGPYPSRSGGPIYSYSDNMTWIHGSHTFKFGSVFERSGQNDRDQVNVNGTPAARTIRTDASISRTRASPATPIPASPISRSGRFNSYAEIGPRDYTISRGNMFEFFAQDAWKVTRN